MPPRWVLVDDTDSSITYTGSWFQATPSSLDGLGSFGPTYQGTSHGTNGTASFSYSFEGSAMNVLGTIANVSQSSGVSASSWECFMDGVSFDGRDDVSFVANNRVLCAWNNNGTSGTHVLTVSAVSQGHTFWFDWLQYEPPSNASLQHAVVYLDRLDAAIQYDNSWQPVVGGTAYAATKYGSAVTIDFIGTQLGWYGLIPPGPAQSPSLVTYAIDGQTVPTNFIVQGLTKATTFITYNQQFFQTPTLSSSGPHQIVVTFLGNGTFALLTLTSIHIQNGSLSVSAPYSPSSSSSSSTPSSSSASSNSTASSNSPTSPSSHVSAGPIVGGVLGGIGLLCLLFIIFFRKLRRPSALLLSPDKEEIVEPFHVASQPAHTMGQQMVATSSVASRPVTKTMGKQALATSSTPATATMTMTMQMSSSAVTPTHELLTTDGEGARENSSRVVLHQDGGIRLEDDIVDIPPVYMPRVV